MDIIFRKKPKDFEKLKAKYEGLALFNVINQSWRLFSVSHEVSNAIREDVKML